MREGWRPAADRLLRVAQASALDWSFAMQICSGFGAPIFHFAETTSTMDEARRLAASGSPPGSLVVADWQSDGRGRGAGRRWIGGRAESLLATLIAPPSWKGLPGLTLRVGLALALACEDFCRGLGVDAAIELKWPNDLMSRDRKLGGILCESGRDALLVGFGINMAQRGFPGELATKAASLAMLSGRTAPIDRDEFAGDCLRRLASLETMQDWRAQVEARLWMRGRRARIATGLPDAGISAEVLIAGIDADGALLAEDLEGRPLRFLSAELLPFGTR